MENEIITGFLWGFRLPEQSNGLRKVQSFKRPQFKNCNRGSDPESMSKKLKLNAKKRDYGKYQQPI